jgi:hypothetical protein
MEVPLLIGGGDAGVAEQVSHGVTSHNPLTPVIMRRWFRTRVLDASKLMARRASAVVTEATDCATAT